MATGMSVTPEKSGGLGIGFCLGLEGPGSQQGRTMMSMDLEIPTEAPWENSLSWHSHDPEVE